MSPRFSILLALLALSCGAAQPAPEAPDPAGGATPGAVDPTAAPDELPTEEEIDAAEAAGEGPPPPDEEAADPPVDENRQRTVNYRVTGDGLEVEVEGLTLLVQAEVAKRGSAWGVRVKVEASADGSDQSLLSPARGPLMFAAQVTKNGNVEKTGDTRDGEDDVVVTDGDSMTFAREFPTKGEKAFKRGTTLKLMTGLWGVGKVGQKRRPLRKLAIVQLVVPKKGEPRVFVNPPE